METTLSVISQLPQTKSEIDLFAEKTIASIQNNGEDAIDLTIKLKAIEKSFEKIRKGINDIAIEQAELNGKDYFYENAKVEVVEVGTKYDYSNCNDEILEDLIKESDNIKEKIKERQTFLKSIRGQLTIVDEDTGETIRLYPPVKTSSTSIKITLNK